jgi:hypothetical protein
MPMMEVSAAEEAYLKKVRQRAQEFAWLCHGVLHAADHLDQLGRESCGGEGEKMNPDTGYRYGESLFEAAQHLRHYGARMSASPPADTKLP